MSKITPDELNQKKATKHNREIYSDPQIALCEEFFRKTIKNLLESQDYTQIEIATELGISPSTLSKILNGKQMLSFELALTMSAYFGWNIADLIMDSTDNKSQSQKDSEIERFRKMIVNFLSNQTRLKPQARNEIAENICKQLSSYTKENFY